MKEIIERVLEIEGDYSNHEHDSGGKTRFGITENVARKHGYYGLIERMPKSLAIEIYKDDYWDVMFLNDILQFSSNLVEKLFNIGINIGCKKTITFLQRCLNVLNKEESLYEDIYIDGIMGRVTLIALREFYKKRGSDGIDVLIKMINCLQGVHYIELSERRPKDESFIYGWFSRRIT